MTAVLAWVGVGALGALGTLARFQVGRSVTARLATDFPAGTFVVNMTGGFLLGLLTGLSLSSNLMLAVGTGFFGGYTTFSTWMVEAQHLGEDGESVLLYAYLFGSLLAGLGAAAGGWALGTLAS